MKTVEEMPVGKLATFAWIKEEGKVLLGCSEEEAEEMARVLGSCLVSMTSGTPAAVVKRAVKTPHEPSFRFSTFMVAEPCV